MRGLKPPKGIAFDIADLLRARSWAGFHERAGDGFAFQFINRGEFAFGCVTGSFAGGGDHNAVEFDWDGNDEMDEACGSGWAELQPDGSLQGEINFHGGDDIAFIAHHWPTSSTAC